MDKRLILSEGANPNYLATICRVGKLFPIENADRLMRTVVNGYDMVVSKDFREGDIVVYFPVESCISKKYLSANNQYGRSDFELNGNAEEVKALLSEAESMDDEEKAVVAEKVKSMCGFFGANGRVRILKLRGQYSMGFLAAVETLVRYEPSLADVDWDGNVGAQFNYVGKDLLCSKYVPKVKPPKEKDNGREPVWRKTMKRLRRFDCMIDGQFAFHYETEMLVEHMDRLSPSTPVSISLKCHGSSIILANVLCKKRLSVLRRMGKFFGFRVQDTEYKKIFSSRRVIQNEDINPSHNSFYAESIYYPVFRDFGQYVPEGYTVYGEVVGYAEGVSTMIQKGYDYGCEPGTWKFMPYRMTETDGFGKRRELSLKEVDEWTESLLASLPELKDKVLRLTIFHYGTMKELYPDINPSTHWRENVLERLKNEKRFLMEENEPLCKNKVPREGIVLRIIGDKFPEAWKLKCRSFYEREAKQHDKGESDIEETA